MDLLIILAMLAAAGVFLAFTGLVMPPRVRLEKPERGLMNKLQQRLDAAELPVSAYEFLSMCGVVALAVGAVAVMLGAPILAVAGVIIAPLLVWQRYEGQRDKFLQDYNASLAEIVQLLREGFSATGSMRTAFEHAVRNGPAPAVADFDEVWTAQATGTALEAAFEPVLARRHSPYLRMVAEALTLKAQEGGSAGEVLEGLETMIREQVHLRREIAAKQGQARLESIIVSAAPIFFFVVIKLVPWMRQYEDGFYRTFLGQIVLAVALVFSILSFFLSNKIATAGLTLEVKEEAPV
jgi:Flp pilus assembly protein TadB